jgi:tryptophan synthase alpha chain
MGFGISGPDQAVEATRFADGVVVGAALMRAAIDGATPEQVGELVGAIRAAIDGGRA